MMCKVDEQKGLVIEKTYQNKKQARVFMHYITEVSRRQLKDKIDHSKYLAIMSDGSTDSAVLEEELLYTRVRQAGKVQVHFDGIQAVEKPNAENITAAIIKMKREVCEDEERAHRLELTFKDAVKSCPQCTKLDDLLSSLYVFYHKSKLNRANLKNSFKVLGMKPLIPTRVEGTRCLAHLFRALDHFLRGYKA
ncbi:hypothetical protein DPEC_G00217780 [Dallia pectoralis]|uniref:Uncharacterized protein n=1 Tax=Dallia pectoralis TaxID=75939 RepID=A0ACC2G2X2_DALPE|nr:hypothetical protein DPEC_G00217780 [Dallia pectoralis]